MTLHLEGGLARRGDAPLGTRCPVDRTMRLIGNRTAVLLLREAFYGVTRFDQLRRRVGVTEAVAAQRLRELVDAGVLTKEPYREPGQRTRYEYVLTEAGHALLPLMLGLMEWGGRYAPEEHGSPTAVHRDCGAPVHSTIRCEAGHDVPEDEVAVHGAAPSRS